MKIELIATHKELKELDWSMSEFKALTISGEIKNPMAYKPAFKITVFGFTFKTPAPCVKFVTVKVVTA